MAEGLTLIQRTGGGGGGDLPEVEAYTPLPYEPTWGDWVPETEAFAAGAFYKDPWGRVFVEGALMAIGDPGVGPVIATLPPGYRPAQLRMAIILAGASPISLQVQENGDLVPESVSDGIYLLDFSFRAA